ncbi:hypothetical protein CIHG_05481 [Coccidioides immitis H538.4]|uniref:Uncharacterized protein n=3 Tax=Coccidioides immitis TaxID=5501 RepID=A0A0J8R537_COCIT|nr:hypothetical protein CIRG_05716 [Coccidioides immitis RMSCC 2394]KMU80224.1 hypothetical protein CISG_08330 [Coccidioides immitis RMSCC 3703]KMU87714.1 hypothetical protein CIHG_05481 [Coccidioides immitis H538.4]
MDKLFANVWFLETLDGVSLFPRVSVTIQILKMEARQEACLRTLYTAFRRGFSCLPGANLPVIERILVGVKRRRSRWLDPRSFASRPSRRMPISKALGHLLLEQTE